MYNNLIMVRRITPYLIILLVLGLPAAYAAAPKVTAIRFSASEERVRIVLEVSEKISYKVASGESEVSVYLPRTVLKRRFKTKVGDKLLDRIQIKKIGKDLRITLPLNYYVPAKVYALEGPDRLVIDLDRLFEEKLEAKIAEGVDFLGIRKGLKSGPLLVSVLRVDPKIVEVAPRLARKEEGQEQGQEEVEPWMLEGAKEAEIIKRHFYKAPVSSIIKEWGKIAGINGGYYTAAGRPLGALMIDKELISFPLYNRSALLLTDHQKAYIENIKVEGRLKLLDGSSIHIDGINQPIAHGAEVMVFTPQWGRTREQNLGFNVLVKNGRVASVAASDVDISGASFVVSAHGEAGAALADRIKVGDRLQVIFDIQPEVRGLRHILSGGPRLVKDGGVYITSEKEKFKKDVARGRAARSAVGITEDQKLILVAVDGAPRSNAYLRSIGMTLDELAELMISLGAKEALNLDGGSSTAMVIGDQLMNFPTRGYAKPVSNALMVRFRPRPFPALPR